MFELWTSWSWVVWWTVRGTVTIIWNRMSYISKILPPGMHISINNLLNYLKVGLLSYQRKIKLYFTCVLIGILLHLKTFLVLLIGDASIPFSLLRSNHLGHKYCLCQQTHCLFFSVFAKWNELCPQTILTIKDCFWESQRNWLCCLSYFT